MGERSSQPVMMGSVWCLPEEFGPTRREWCALLLAGEVSGVLHGGSIWMKDDERKGCIARAQSVGVTGYEKV